MALQGGEGGEEERRGRKGGGGGGGEEGGGEGEGEGKRYDHCITGQQSNTQSMPVWLDLVHAHTQVV